MTRARRSLTAARRSDPFLASHCLWLQSSRAMTRSLTLFAATLVAFALRPAPAAAQQDTSRWGGVSVSPADAPRAGARPPDFLFATPKGSITLRLGMLFPRAHSDIFNEAFDTLSLSHSAFRSLSGSGELSWRVGRQLDAMLALGYARRTADSHYRHFFEYDSAGNQMDIFQSTTLIEVPITVGVKTYLVERGRQIGHFAYIPTRVTPYVGLAGGFVWHRFHQVGDFINFTAGDPQNRPLDFADLESEGFSPTLQALVGTDLMITRKAAVQLEARYSWSSANMGQMYQGYDRLDLAGLQATIGLSWRY